MIARVLLGALLAALIAFAARRAGSLTTSGAIAAVAAGTAAAAAGWSWAVLLILYFASSTALSRLGRAEKERRTASVVEKGGARDAAQVAANGLVFTAAALGMCVHADPRWVALGGGALAASAADTWATEIGTLYGGEPRSIVTGRRVARGTSGGVTLAGTAATVAAALVIALIAAAGDGADGYGADGGPWLLALAVFVAGLAGSAADSIVGGTVQSRRWCATCARETERRVHDCGTTTSARRGWRWLDNDAVNLASTVVGGLLAAWIVR